MLTALLPTVTHAWQRQRKALLSTHDAPFSRGHRCRRLEVIVLRQAWNHTSRRVVNQWMYPCFSTHPPAHTPLESTVGQIGGVAFFPAGPCFTSPKSSLRSEELTRLLRRSSPCQATDSRRRCSVHSWVEAQARTSVQPFARKPQQERRP